MQKIQTDLIFFNRYKGGGWELIGGIMNQIQTCMDKILNLEIGKTFTSSGLAYNVSCHKTVALKAIRHAKSEQIIQVVGSGRNRKYRRVLKDQVNQIETNDPELDYSQIGKSIVEHIKRVEKLAESSIDHKTTINQLLNDNKKLTDKISEQHDQIIKLNRKITELNDKLRVAKTYQPTVSDTNKFKLSELARIK